MANEARASDAKLRVLTEVSQKDSRVAPQFASDVVLLDSLESIFSSVLCGNLGPAIFSTISAQRFSGHGL